MPDTRKLLEDQLALNGVANFFHDWDMGIADLEVWKTGAKPKQDDVFAAANCEDTDCTCSHRVHP